MSIDREKIAKLLTDRGASLPCHRCGKSQFTVLEAYSTFTLQENPFKTMVLGGKVVPVALIACNNCGAITPHALGPLNLIPTAEEK